MQIIKPHVAWHLFQLVSFYIENYKFQINRKNLRISTMKYMGDLQLFKMNTPCPTAPVRCAPLANQVNNFAESALQSSGPNLCLSGQ